MAATKTTKMEHEIEERDGYCTWAVGYDTPEGWDHIAEGRARTRTEAEDMCAAVRGVLALHPHRIEG